MKRLLLALLVMVVIVCLGLAGAGEHLSRARVYTVAELSAQLTRDPAAWADRIVRIRALAEPCPAWGSPYSPARCLTERPVLVDPEASDLAGPIPLVLGASDPLLAIFRRLPLAGQFVPQAPAPSWETLRTYRVRLHAEAKGRCDTTTCFEAVLLDM